MLLMLGILLAVVWLVGLLAFKVVGFAIHLLLVAAVIMIIWHLVKRGANKVGIGGDGDRTRPL
jgi:hypothetical protein